MTDAPCQRNSRRPVIKPATLGGSVFGTLARFIHCSWASGHGLLLLAGLLAAARPMSGDEPRQDPATQVREVELRGRVVCLAEEMHRKHQALLPTRHDHLWGFQAEDGTFYTLL